MDREKELRRAGWRLVGSASRVHWGWIVIALTAALAWTATKVTIPLLTAAAIDQGIIRDDTQALVTYAGLMIVVGVFQMVVSGLRRYGAFWLAYRTETDLRPQLFAHLQRLHFAFHDEAQTGELMARANTDLLRSTSAISDAAVQRGGRHRPSSWSVVMVAQSWSTLASLALGALPLLNVARRGSRRRSGRIDRAPGSARRPVERRRGDGVGHPCRQGLRCGEELRCDASTRRPTPCSTVRSRPRSCVPVSCRSSTSSRASRSRCSGTAGTS